MGHAKGLLEVRGRPVLAYLLSRLAWPGPTLLVTAPGRERPPGHELFGREVADPVAGQGPLRGLLTAIEHAPTETIVVTAVDMPGATRKDLAWLVGELLRHDAAVVMTSRAGEIEPLPCAIRTDAKSFVTARLAAGQRSLHGIATHPRVEVISADDRDGQTWLNANTPAEWMEFLRTPPE